MADATNKVYYCPIELTLDLVGSKWKPTLLRHLYDGYEAIGELKARMPLATPRTLDTLLAELEKDELIEKTLHSDDRNREQYRLTATGEALGPLLEQLATVGRQYATARDIELLDKEAESAPSNGNHGEQRWTPWTWLPL